MSKTLQESWTCSQCTYIHYGIEAAYLACAMCMELRMERKRKNLSKPRIKGEEVIDEDVYLLESTPSEANGCKPIDRDEDGSEELVMVDGISFEESPEVFSHDIKRRRTDKGLKTGIAADPKCTSEIDMEVAKEGIPCANGRSNADVVQRRVNHVESIAQAGKQQEPNTDERKSISNVSGTAEVMMPQNNINSSVASRSDQNLHQAQRTKFPSRNSVYGDILSKRRFLKDEVKDNLLIARKEANSTVSSDRTSLDVQLKVNDSSSRTSKICDDIEDRKEKGEALKNTENELEAALSGNSEDSVDLVPVDLEAQTATTASIISSQQPSEIGLYSPSGAASIVKHTQESVRRFYKGLESKTDQKDQRGGPHFPRCRKATKRVLTAMKKHGLDPDPSVFVDLNLSEKENLMTEMKLITDRDAGSMPWLRSFIGKLKFEDRFQLNGRTADSFHMNGDGRIMTCKERYHSLAPYFGGIEALNRLYHKMKPRTAVFSSVGGHGTMSLPKLQATHNYVECQIIVEVDGTTMEALRHPGIRARNVGREHGTDEKSQFQDITAKLKGWESSLGPDTFTALIIALPAKRYVSQATLTEEQHKGETGCSLVDAFEARTKSISITDMANAVCPITGELIYRKEFLMQMLLSHRSFCHRAGRYHSLGYKLPTMHSPSKWLSKLPNCSLYELRKAYAAVMEHDHIHSSLFEFALPDTERRKDYFLATSKIWLKHSSSQELKNGISESIRLQNLDVSHSSLQQSTESVDTNDDIDSISKRDDYKANIGTEPTEAKEDLGGPNTSIGIELIDAKEDLDGPNASTGTELIEAKEDLDGPKASIGTELIDAKEDLDGPKASTGTELIEAKGDLDGPNASIGTELIDAKEDLDGPKASTGTELIEAKGDLDGPNASIGTELIEAKEDLDGPKASIGTELIDAKEDLDGPKASTGIELIEAREILEASVQRKSKVNSGITDLLPSGWQSKYDFTTGRTYYFASVSQWERPTDAISWGKHKNSEISVSNRSDSGSNDSSESSTLTVLDTDCSIPGSNTNGSLRPSKSELLDSDCNVSRSNTYGSSTSGSPEGLVHDCSDSHFINSRSSTLENSSDTAEMSDTDRFTDQASDGTPLQTQNTAIYDPQSQSIKESTTKIPRSSASYLPRFWKRGLKGNMIPVRNGVLAEVPVKLPAKVTKLMCKLCLKKYKVKEIRHHLKLYHNIKAVEGKDLEMFCQ